MQSCMKVGSSSQSESVVKIDQEDRESLEYLVDVHNISYVHAAKKLGFQQKNGTWYKRRM